MANCEHASQLARTVALTIGLIAGSGLGQVAPCQAQGAGAGAGLDALRSAQSALIELIKATEPSVVAITHTPPAQANHSPLLFRQGDDGFFRDLRGIPGNARVETPAGAGVVIDASGLVLTQYLVVQPGQQHTIYTVDGDSYPAEIRAADPRSGLAVLDVSVERNDLAPLPIGKAENLQKGSGVVTIGNPNALLTDGQPTASYGTITNLARKADPQVNLNNAKDPLRTGYRTTLHHFGALIQTDARLGWNASGGAVVNLAGELVGITTTVSVIPGHEQSAGYAIPMNAAFRRIVDTLKEGKEVEYGLLGISFSVSARSKTTDGRYGIAVQQAYAGGPAGRAGLRSRDIITDVAGEPTPNADRLQLLVGQQPPGKSLQVSFERDGVQRTADVSLSKHYTLGQKIVTTPAPRWRGILVDYATAVSQTDLERASREGLIDPQGCVVVADVTPDSVSWEQGVRPGMFISHVGGDRVSTPAEFWTAVEQADASVKVRFTQTLGEPNE